MDNSELLTSENTEIIYSAYEYEGYTKMQEQINLFFAELYKRRRNDPYEDGLQASAVIMPDAFASKIAENNGLDPHLITGINLLRFLKRKKTFYKKTASGKFYIIKDELNEITMHGINIRILAGEETLGFLIQAKNESLSSFQFNVIKELIDRLWDFKRNNKYKKVTVGLAMYDSTVEPEDLTDTLYEKLLNIINQNKFKSSRRSFISRFL